MGFFKYDEKTNREWIEIEHRPGTMLSRATIQDYAAGMHMEPEYWVREGLVAWMGFCDGEGAHGCPQDQPTPRTRVPAWRVRLAEWFYTIGDKLTDPPDR